MTLRMIACERRHGDTRRGGNNESQCGGDGSRLSGVSPIVTSHLRPSDDVDLQVRVGRDRGPCWEKTAAAKTTLFRIDESPCCRSERPRSNRPVRTWRRQTMAGAGHGLELFFNAEFCDIRTHRGSKTEMPRALYGLNRSRYRLRADEVLRQFSLEDAPRVLPNVCRRF